MSKDETAILDTAQHNHKIALQMLDLLKGLESSGMLRGELLQCLKDATLLEEEARSLLELLRRGGCI